MKKKLLIILSIISIVVISGVIWYISPLDLIQLNPEDVLEISIFDGNTGTSLHITEKEDITYIINNLNVVKLKRKKVSTGYTGYSFKTTIYLNNGEEANGWNNFIINSKDTIRKDPFFYNVVEGSIDYQYIKTLIQEQNRSAELYDLIPMVRIDGRLYLDTGKESDITGRCGVMDGQITSTVEPFEKPTKDDQSNFGVGYEYQFINDNSIDIYMNDKWIRFENRE
ncbi:hypothetical protein ACF3M2_09960 [Tissierella carlieri]|jgi:uncharacterized protein YxeA|uniref:hypothetical protein n=1 Tax=Tissierella carlieri TaxID=689904 RepID=UPI0038707308